MGVVHACLHSAGGKVRGWRRPGLPPAPARSTLGARSHDTAESIMSKGMDQKKQEKKKPEKTLKEKRAEKKEKKGK
jgi:hypothetical protein